MFPIDYNFLSDVENILMFETSPMPEDLFVIYSAMYTDTNISQAFNPTRYAGVLYLHQNFWRFTKLPMTIAAPSEKYTWLIYWSLYQTSREKSKAELRNINVFLITSGIPPTQFERINFLLHYSTAEVTAIEQALVDYRKIIRDVRLLNYADSRYDATLSECQSLIADRNIDPGSWYGVIR